MQSRTPDWGGLGSPDAMASLPRMAPLPLTGAPLARVAAAEGETSSPAFHTGSTRLFLRERDGDRDTGRQPPPIPPGRGPHRPYPCQPRRAAALRPGPPRRGGSGAFLFLSLPSFPPSLPPFLPPSRSRRGAMAQGSRCPHGLSPPLPFPSLSAAAITSRAGVREAPSPVPPRSPHGPSLASGRACGTRSLLPG